MTGSTSRTTTLVLSAVLGLCLLGAAGQTAADTQPMFPTLEADDLNGREVTLPGDFPGNPTLVFVAFKQGQQGAVNEWVAALDLADRPEVPWVELPTINKGFRVMKGFVDNGMRSGITATDARARTISIYGQSALMDPLGMESKDQIFTLVVRQNGEVLEMVRGAPDDNKISALSAAMGVMFSSP